MTEEEYFRKNYPDSCYGDKPLSPHWDFFQDGVEFGERQSESKIAILEEENLYYKDIVEADSAEWEEQGRRISELEAEVKEWKDKAELWCKTANLKDHNIMINKELERENAELKETNNKLTRKCDCLTECNDGLQDLLADDIDVLEKLVQFEKENAELKDNFKIAKDNEYEYSSLLTKAKEIIKEMLCVLPKENIEGVYEITEEAEQFLKETR